MTVKSKEELNKLDNYLEDIQDYYSAIEVLKNPGRIYSMEEVREICELGQSKVKQLLF